MGDQTVQLSKALSRLLRHAAIEEGVPITSDGWMKAADAIAHLNRGKKRFSEEMLGRVIEGNDKQRFGLRRGTHGAVEIRANQGHSMPGIVVDMTELTVATAPATALHGTYYKAWRLIKEGGLNKMSRQHIHMARALPGESGVISGMRSSCELVVHVDVHAAIAAGIKFFESANGVILTAGIDGVLPPAFFASVTDRKSGAQIDLSAPTAEAKPKGKPTRSEAEIAALRAERAAKKTAASIAAAPAVAPIAAAPIAASADSGWRAVSKGVVAQLEELIALPEAEKARLAPAHMHAYSRAQPAPPLPPLAEASAAASSSPPPLLVTAELDTCSCAMALKTAGLRPAALNLANEYNCGGAWEGGGGSQEEDVFRSSSLPLSLWPHRRADDGRLASYDERLPRRAPLYPWSDAAVVYSPEVLLLRAGRKRFAASEAPTVSVISAAAQDLRSGRHHYQGPFDAEWTRQKCRSILWAAVRYGHDALVLGALGCGAFHNPPDAIAATFAELLAGEFAGRFRVVVFGVIKSRTNVEAFGAHFPLVPSLELAIAKHGLDPDY
jgi:2'-phosphotransferase